MLTQFLSNKKTVISIMLSVLLYLAYSYDTNRGDFYDVLLKFSSLFLLFIFLYKQQLSWRVIIGIGLLFRLVLLVSTPNLSQDFYRFIWDGRMIINGYNPYLYLPENFLTGNYIVPNQAKELINGMQELNASHYSNYPPLNQLCFAIAALFSSKSIIGSIIIMRVLLIAADIGTFIFGRKILSHLNLNPNMMVLYFLNPFIITELTGNLHFEGIMIFLLSWGLYMFFLNKLTISGIAIGLSISLKLLPLMFLPLFIKHLKFKKQFLLYGVISLTVLLTILPFISEHLISNYSRTIKLWFGNFEFNGSFYLLARQIGYEITGYNTIKVITKITPLLVIAFIGYLSIKQKNKDYSILLKALLFALSFYLFTSTTVHPWYIAMLLFLGILAGFKYPLIWSFTIILSYSFYHNDGFTNNYLLISIQYILVFSTLFYELINKKKFNNSFNV